MKLPPMNSLRAFESAARHCSFKRAGEELHVTPGAISRFVKLLETDLGVKLFERLPNGLRLTEPGKTLYPRLSRAFSDIEAATNQAANPKNEIKFVVPATIGTRLLIGKVSAFNAAHLGPKVHYNVEFQNWDDFFRSDFDLGVCCYETRYDSPPDLEFRFLRPEALTPLCAPKLLRGDGALKTPEDLTRFELLHCYPDKADWKKWLRAAQVETVDPACGQVFMTMELAARAAIEGYGVTIGDLSLFEEEIRKGDLVQPFDLVLSENTGYFLFGKPDRLSQPHVSAFCDWLMAQAGMDMKPLAAGMVAKRADRTGARRAG